MAEALQSLRPDVVCSGSVTGGIEVETVLAEVGYQILAETEVCRLWVSPG